MALIEQGLKVFTAIYKRIFRALKQEFRLIFEINKKHLNVQKYLALVDYKPPQPQVPPQMMGHNGGPPVDPQAMPPGAKPPMPGPGMPPDMAQQPGMMPPQMPMPPPVDPSQDYQGQMDIMPVSDPSNVTDMQRMAKAQFVMEQLKEGNPFIKGKLATRRALEAARIERVEEIIQDPPPAPPDPAAEKAKADIEAKQASAHLDQQSKQADMQMKQDAAQLDLSVKAETARMQLEVKQRELDLKERELAMKEREMMGQSALREAQVGQKWKELEVKEAEAKVKAESSDAD